jgi:hypothetical protein
MLGIRARKLTTIAVLPQISNSTKAPITDAAILRGIPAGFENGGAHLTKRSMPSAPPLLENPILRPRFSRCNSFRRSSRCRLINLVQSHVRLVAHPLPSAGDTEPRRFACAGAIDGRKKNPSQRKRRVAAFGSAGLRGWEVGRLLRFQIPEAAMVRPTKAFGQTPKAIAPRKSSAAAGARLANGHPRRLASHLTSWNGETKIDVKASNPTWDKWLPSWPTSPHWYDISRFRRYMAAHIAHRPNTTVREFVGELRGLSSTAKQKVILEEIGASHVSLHDYFGRTKANRDNIAKLLTALKSPGLGPPARSSPVSTGRPGSTIRSGNLAAAVTAWTPSWRIFAPRPRSRSSWCCIWRAHASVIPTAASRPSWSKVK